MSTKSDPSRQYFSPEGNFFQKGWYFNESEYTEEELVSLKSKRKYMCNTCAQECHNLIDRLKKVQWCACGYCPQMAAAVEESKHCEEYKSFRDEWLENHHCSYIL